MVESNILSHALPLSPLLEISMSSLVESYHPCSKIKRFFRNKIFFFCILILSFAFM